MSKKINKIVIFGAGFVGMSLALLLSKNNKVTIVDKDHSVLESVKKDNIFIKNNYEKNNKNSNLFRTKNIEAFHNLESFNFSNHDFAIICLPTDFHEKKKSFDVDLITETINYLFSKKFDGTVVIKSTVPVGYTSKLKSLNRSKKILFSPEFLREGHEIEDNIFPDRVVVGGDKVLAKEFASLLTSFALNKPKVFLVKSKEAESIKLFSNSYLANRIAFFNELDSFSLENNLNAKKIIQAVCSDSRIGNHYNNPSFGYGGYCLPKDTKQLQSNFKKIPQRIISATLKSNEERKEYIVKKILEGRFKIFGIYLLGMKLGSNNFRNSSILKIVNDLKSKNKKIIIFEPNLKVDKFLNLDVYGEFKSFAEESEIIIANRYSEQLMSYHKKVFTRDIFKVD